MPDILHRLVIRAPVEQVFAAVTSPTGLDAWWTLEARGEPQPGSEYDLIFGPDYAWRADVTRVLPNEAFELELTHADADWKGTRVGFDLTREGDSTCLFFHHRGWTEAGEHYAQSNCCWAMYLRILRRHLEHGERVPYGSRDEA